MNTKSFFDENISIERNIGLEKILKKVVKTNSKTKLLDAGCGVGKYFYLFKGKLYGVDYAKKRIEKAKKLNKGVNFKVGDVSKLPYRSSFFDYLISIDVVQHIESEKKREKSIKEFNRVLKKGGTLVFVFDNKYYFRGADIRGWSYFIHKYTFSEVTELLKKNNFKIKSKYRIGVFLGLFSKKGVIVAEKK